MTKSRWSAVAVALIALLIPPSGRADDRTLVVAMNHEPEKLDATMALNGVITLPVMENVTEKLVDLDSDGKPVPGLGTWEIAADGLTITFHLRPGIKFQSGDPFTARDVVFSHDRMAKNPLYQSVSRNLDRVEAADDFTVKFIFRKPDATFFIRRALIIVSKTYHDRAGEDAFVHHPVGTGPYKFVAYQPGQSIDLDAFDGYWGGAPSVKHVRFQFINDDMTRLAKLRSGEADIILNAPYTDVDALHSEGFKIATLETTPTTSINLIKANPNVPWHDIRVRQAIAYAIDANAIIKGLLHGIPKHYAGYAPGQVGYDPDLKNYPYDPALSKKLLAAAGYPNGFTMPLVYWIGEDYGMRETAEAAALYLKAVGIDSEVQGLQVPKMVAIMRQNAKSPEKATQVSVGPTPFANYYDPTVALSFVFASSSPFSTYRNSDFDQLVDHALQTFDETKRGNLVRQATRVLHNDYVLIPIWNNVALYAMKRNVDFKVPPHTLIRMEVKDVTVH
jgi:peptide/nickel transport system substrate-binding protein